jgi:hypothetical protein
MPAQAGIRSIALNFWCISMDTRLRGYDERPIF